MKFIVATVLTVYGIETHFGFYYSHHIKKLQQYLPFTVLKREGHRRFRPGGESCNSTYRLRY